MNILELPFNQHLGLAMVQRGREQVVSLEPKPCHLNHLGTVHAGVLYSLAEAASGHELQNQLGQFSDDLFAVVRSSNVKYRKPADGRLVALANIDNAKALACRQRLSDKRRAVVDVLVQLVLDDDTLVFAGEFSWFVSRTPNATED